MLQKTRGIVLHYIRYGDSSIIVKIYTEQLGVQSYIVNGVRSTKAKSNKIALYQPLTLLELVVYYEPEKQKLFRIHDVRCAIPYQTIPFDIRKTTVALFLAEILSKTLKEETAHEALYDFIERSFVSFDEARAQFEDFHFHFLLGLSSFLGFLPHSASEMITQLKEIHRWRVPLVYEEEIVDWLENTLQTPSYTPLASAWRGYLLDVIIDFYGLHIEGVQQLKSLDVLRELGR